MQHGLSRCSTDSGSYCEARQKLPVALLQRLVQKTGRELQGQTPAEWLFHGRQVKVVDGTTVSMPDTAANTTAFDKPRNQRGPGPFPVARLLVLLCLATGAALEVVIGPCRGKKTGELSLYRSLHDTLEAGDIVLADRLFCTYFDIARLQQRGVVRVRRRSAKICAASFPCRATLSRFRRAANLPKPQKLAPRIRLSGPGICMYICFRRRLPLPPIRSLKIR